ncbi:hypothetical protein BC739_009441 [Kutzneria viridogrisea]|uniref:Uncharacterized protein n=1 Tax=Kutzneria viridogrisea TaxID=47990 RepID=A0ABR6BZZ9_9PSEU|nr:hypothetical protein [Kutzneria viridogrisea]
MNGLEPATVTVPSSPAVAGPRGARPGWMSRHLVQRAVWCLPSAHRARYREEFDAELAEIAETRGRVRQWGYAVRLVGRAVALRHAVQAAVPQREQS